jgi:hypothetical protein
MGACWSGELSPKLHFSQQKFPQIGFACLAAQGGQQIALLNQKALSVSQIIPR